MISRLVFIVLIFFTAVSAEAGEAKCAKTLAELMEDIHYRGYGVLDSRSTFPPEYGKKLFKKLKNSGQTLIGLYGEYITPEYHLLLDELWPFIEDISVKLRARTQHKFELSSAVVRIHRMHKNEYEEVERWHQDSGDLTVVVPLYGPGPEFRTSWLRRVQTYRGQTVFIAGKKMTDAMDIVARWHRGPKGNRLVLVMVFDRVAD